MPSCALAGVDLMIADRLDGWPLRARAAPGMGCASRRCRSTPALLGATTVTEPTPFCGQVTLGGMLDDWQNIWWLWAPAPGQPDPRPRWEGRQIAQILGLESHG